jgi:hypothetical protein
MDGKCDFLLDDRQIFIRAGPHQKREGLGQICQHGPPEWPSLMRPAHAIFRFPERLAQQGHLETVTQLCGPQSINMLRA